jgi:hydroxymethylglutaryl-CoA lyase
MGRRGKEQGFAPEMINTQLATTEELSQFFFMCSVAERWKFLERAIKLAHDAGLIFQVSILTAWSCPYNGETSLDDMMEVTDRLFKMGYDIVRPCDPFGDVTPDRAYEYFCRVLDKHPDTEKHTFHLHDWRGVGITSYVAAMEAGCTRFDTSLGGLGGPFASIVGGIHAQSFNECKPQGRKCGLVSTEDFVMMCDTMGIETGIDLDKVINLGKWMEKILGRRLWSACLEAGRVPRGSQVIKGREKDMA